MFGDCIVCVEWLSGGCFETACIVCVDWLSGGCFVTACIVCVDWFCDFF